MQPFVIWCEVIAALSLALPSASGAPAGASEYAPDRRVAITVDDLPYAGGPQRLVDARIATERLLDALRDYDVPALGFVTGANVLVDDQVDERLDMLRAWRDAGATLGNHSHSHRSYHRVPEQEYLDDATKGLVLPDLIMKETGGRCVFYRHPFNHGGDTSAKRERFAAYLEEHGLTIAPFTVEHSDYMFNRVYVDALARDDVYTATRVIDTYVTQLGVAFDFAEATAMDTFGGTIPQILLIHANALNGVAIGRMLAHLQGRGYRFITIDEAMRDPAYETPDEYVADHGPSWLHRWRANLGMSSRLGDEPEPPAWLVTAYERLTKP